MKVTEQWLDSLEKLLKKSKEALEKENDFKIKLEFNRLIWYTNSLLVFRKINKK